MAIDNKKLGTIARERRHKMKLSQREVYEYTGISEETLRLLEKGAREPRLITLERLSELYKYDLISAAAHCRNKTDFFSASFLEEINYFLSNGKYTEFENKIDELIKSLRKSYINDAKKTKENMKFVESLENFKNVNLYSTKFSIHTSIYLEELLTFFNFSKEGPLEDKSLHYIEIQIGIILSAIYRKSDHFEAAEEILNKIISTLDDEKFLNPRQMDYLIVAYYHLCTLYHRRREFDRILDTLDQLYQRYDLKYRKIYFNTLQFRKGVTLYLKGNDNYKHILATLLMSENETRAAEYYETLIREYDIKAYEFMDMRDVKGFENFTKPSPPPYPQ